MSFILFGDEPVDEPLVRFDGSCDLWINNAVDADEPLVRFDSRGDLWVNKPVTVQGQIRFYCDSGFTYRHDFVAHKATWLSTEECDLDVTRPIEGINIGVASYMPKPYRLLLRKVTGELIGEAHNATFTSELTDDLNSTPSFTFTLPYTDPLAPYVQAPDCEALVLQGPDVICGGVVTADNEDSGSDVVSYIVKGIRWYGTKRRISRFPTEDLVVNGTFEQGLYRWRQKGSPNPLIVSTVNGAPPMSSSRHGKAVRLGPSTDWESFIYKDREWTVPLSRKDGDTFKLVAWAYVPSSWVAPMRGSRGLWLEQFSATEPHPNPVLAAKGYKKSIQSVNVPIDENTPKDKWVRMEAAMTVKPATTVTYDEGGGATVATVEAPTIISFRLHPTGGYVYWSQVSLTWNERRVYDGWDQAAILNELNTIAQDESLGKSDLGITAITTPTGVKRDRTFLFSDNQSVEEVVDEFTKLANGLDVEYLVTKTDKYFITHYPYKGTFKQNYPLVLGKNVVKFTRGRDAERSANSMKVIADGNDDARDEGTYIDNEAYDSGLILEDILDATPGSSISSLQDQARRAGNRFKKPAVTLTVVVNRGSAHWRLYLVGDTVRVFIKRGRTNIQGRIYRIMSKSLNPNDDTLTLTIAEKEIAYDAAA